MVAASLRPCPFFSFASRSLDTRIFESGRKPKDRRPSEEGFSSIGPLFERGRRLARAANRGCINCDGISKACVQQWVLSVSCLRHLSDCVMATKTLDCLRRRNLSIDQRLARRSIELDGRATLWEVHDEPDREKH